MNAYSYFSLFFCLVGIRGAYIECVFIMLITCHSSIPSKIISVLGCHPNRDHVLLTLLKHVFETKIILALRCQEEQNRMEYLVPSCLNGHHFLPYLKLIHPSRLISVRLCDPETNSGVMYHPLGIG